MPRPVSNNAFQSGQSLSVNSQTAGTAKSILSQLRTRYSNCVSKIPFLSLTNSEMRSVPDASLAGLPVELQQMITTHCEGADINRLRQTCRHLSRLEPAAHHQVTLSVEEMQKLTNVGLPVKAVHLYQQVRLGKQVTDLQLKTVIESGHLDGMRSLDLTRCQHLTVECLPSILSLPNLDQLKLYGCIWADFRSLDPDLVSSKVKHLDVSHLYLHSLDLAGVTRVFPQLQTLDVSFSPVIRNLDNVRAEDVRQLRQLKLHYFYHDCWAIRNFCAKAKGLTHLQLASGREGFTVDFPTHDVELPDLRSLRLTAIEKAENVARDLQSTAPDQSIAVTISQ